MNDNVAELVAEHLANELIKRGELTEDWKAYFVAGVIDTLSK